jgi:hypothetical protein
MLQMLTRQPFFILGKREPGLLHGQQRPAIDRGGRIFGEQSAQFGVASMLRMFRLKWCVCIHSSSRSTTHQSR